MPILEVEIVIEDIEQLPAGLAAEIATRAAAVFGTAAGRTWVRLRTLPLSRYAEDDDGPPAGVRPVFVSVLHRQRPENEALDREVTRLTAALATVCGRPSENVHILYEADASGRAAFGGVLVK